MSSSQIKAPGFAGGYLLNQFYNVQMQINPMPIGRSSSTCASGLIALSCVIPFLLWFPEYIQYNSLPTKMRLTIMIPANPRARINIALGASLTRVAALQEGAERSLLDPFAGKKPGWHYCYLVIVLELSLVIWAILFAGY
ncbi:MAG: hypothetical protein WB870_15870 [Gallionellaceae bacterium]